MGTKGVCVVRKQDFSITWPLSTFLEHVRCVTLNVKIKKNKGLENKGKKLVV